MPRDYLHAVSGEDDPNAEIARGIQRELREIRGIVDALKGPRKNGSNGSTTVLYRWVLGIVAFVVTLSLAGMVLRMNKQDTTAENLSAQIQALQLFKAETQSNRFTNGDGARDRELATERMNELENRVTRIEGN